MNSIRKNDLHAQSGYKLRKIRLRRHKSVKEIANACDVSEASIRFYENGSRQLTDDRIKDIASILNVDESALQDHRLNSISDIMHLFYDLEDADLPFDFDIEPKDRITDYAYYAMVTVLRLRQILTRDNGEVRAFIDACGTPSVKAKFITTMSEALHVIDRELGRMVEQARITAPINDDSFISRKMTDSQDTIGE